MFVDHPDNLIYRRLQFTATAQFYSTARLYDVTSLFPDPKPVSMTLRTRLCEYK